MNNNSINNINNSLFIKGCVDFMSQGSVLRPDALWTSLRTIPLIVSAFFGKGASGTICSTIGCNFTAGCTFPLKLHSFSLSSPTSITPSLSLLPSALLLPAIWGGWKTQCTQKKCFNHTSKRIHICSRLYFVCFLFEQHVRCVASDGPYKALSF